MSVSPQTVLRIWDCLFNEGSKIIFRVALTLIKQHQAFILEATSFADICEKFKEITKGSFVTECHTFMQVSVWVCSACTLLCGSICLACGMGVLALHICLAKHLSLCFLWIWISASTRPFTLPSQANPEEGLQPFQVLFSWSLVPEADGWGHLPGVQQLLPLPLCISQGVACPKAGRVQCL